MLDILKDKHPQSPAEACADALVDEGATEVPPFHPVLFDKITGEAIRHAALRTEGSSGPSGIDATGWRRMCTAFHAASTSLCNSLAAVARRLCTEYVDPTPLHALIGCRLIPLDKKPGVRPIGVCETTRRIIGKTIASVLRHEIRAAAGPLQMCAGQPAGCEAATHALDRVFAEADTEAVILVDASNAFNSMNRQLALRNIPVLCPALAWYVINTYRCHAPLFAFRLRRGDLLARGNHPRGPISHGDVCNRSSTPDRPYRPPQVRHKSGSQTTQPAVEHSSRYGTGGTPSWNMGHHLATTSIEKNPGSS